MKSPYKLKKYYNWLYDFQMHGIHWKMFNWKKKRWLMNICLKYKINYLWLQLLKVIGGGCLSRVNKMEIHVFENLKKTK